MAETTSTAGDNLTRPGAMTPWQITPTVHDNQGAPPAGVISDAAYDRLPTDADRDRYSRVRAGPDGGSQWQERAALPSETAPPTEQSGQQQANSLNPAETYKFGDL
jgi:hypothetical protein